MCSVVGGKRVCVVVIPALFVDVDEEVDDLSFDELFMKI
jgi:hypothetical protein